MKHKKLKIAVLISVIALLLVLVSLTVYAYFSTLAYVYTDEGKEVAHLGMNLSLLFDKLESDGSNVDGTELPFVNPANGNQYVVDTNQTWGTAQNPYVISEIRHLQNLSALQDIGYFYKLNIKNNYNEDGSYIAESNDKPYFLICKPNGTPTVIDGTGISIKPIGTDEYPFIAEIGGAITDGTATVDVKGGLATDTSAIFNIKVMSKRKMPDHGLFGYVSYLGQPESLWAEDATTFNGYISSISDILMADVSLEVKDTNFVDTVADWINTHIFAYKELPESAQSTVPHETHHIGILAGHVNYVDVKNVSVYYSNDSVVCIDLNDKKSVVGTGESDDSSADGFDNNYFSSTGIIGYIYSMNPQYEGNVISIGTGSSSAAVGNLGGGGQASGVNPGYVLAADMYQKFREFSKPSQMTADGLTAYELENADNTVVELGFEIYVTLVEKKDANKQLIGWEIAYHDEMGVELVPMKTKTIEYDGKTVSGLYDGDGWKYKESGRELTEDDNFFYCQPEIRSYDKDGNYVVSERFYTSIDDLETYNLTDDDDEVIGTFTCVTGTLISKPSVKVNALNDNMYLYTAKTGPGEDGPALCVQWYRDRLFSNWINLGKEATGRYYFFDGVFTFALSSTADVIREIWENEGMIPKIMLAKANAAGDGDGWTVGKLPNDYTYKTFFTPLQASALSPTDVRNKNLVMLYQSNDQWYIINLMGGSVANSGGLHAELLSSVIAGAGDLVSTTNEFSLEVGKNNRGMFDNYAVKSTGSTIYSASNPLLKLGVNSRSAAQEADNWLGFTVGTQYYPYAGDLIEDSVDGYFAEMLDYTYNSVFVENGTSWGIQFNNVAVRDYDYGLFSGFSWKDPTFTQTRRLVFSGSALSTGTTQNYGLYLYEIRTEIIMLAPEDAPDALVPADGSNKVNENLPADQYILWPMDTFSGATVSQNTTYGVISLEGLGTEGGKGWRYSDGDFLYEKDGALRHIFDLVNGASFGTVASNLFNTGGDLDLSNAFVKATLGSDGSQTYIPMGCVSFKVNKTPAEDDPIKIRVIVAVPTSDVAGGLNANEYAFGLWQNSLYSGQSETFNFEQNGTIAKFELPRSQPLAKDADGNFVTTGATRYVYFDKDKSGAIEESEMTEDNLYNTYFQGETVLVAYEFNVTEAGVYTLGAINCPMQIVYFSADGVASMGRDGTGGAALQGIDFVYDTVDYSDANKIVTVNNAPTEEFKDENGIVYENYNYYYESSCLLHFDNNVQYQNEWVKIFREKIFIRRYYDKNSSEEYQKTALNFKVEGEELTQETHYVKFESYSDKSDTVKETYTLLTPQS